MFDLLNKPYLKVLFALILLFIIYNFISHGIWESFNRIGIDFRYYYDFENNIGRSDIWFVYPPFFWLLMIPWRLIPYPIAKNIWVGLNLGITLFILGWWYYWINRNSFWERAYRFWLILFLAVATLYFYPLIVTLQTGQVNLVLLAILLICLWLYLIGKKTAAAVLLSIAMAIKWLPGLLLVYWFLKKEYRLVVISSITFLLLWLIPIPIFGLEKISRYFSATQLLTHQVFSDYHFLNNTSLLTFWCDTFNRLALPIGLGRGFYFGSIFIIMGVWFSTIWRSRFNREPAQIILEYVWTIATTTVLLPFVESHHFTLVVLLSLAIIAVTPKIRSYTAISMLTISWIMINAGAQMVDVSLLPQKIYLIKYFQLIGVLLGWGGVSVLLLKRKKSPV